MAENPDHRQVSESHHTKKKQGARYQKRLDRLNKKRWEAKSKSKKRPESSLSVVQKTPQVYKRLQFSDVNQAEGEAPCLDYPAMGFVEDFSFYCSSNEERYHSLLDMVKSARVIAEYYMNAELSTRKAVELLEQTLEDGDSVRFRSALATFNSALFELKKKGVPQRVANHWAVTQVPVPVAIRIVEETYQRVVGPRLSEVRGSTPHTSDAYGETYGPLASRINARVGLTRDSKFLDLGSGIGAVAVLTAIQVRCQTYGIEMERSRAQIAASFVSQATLRCRAWGIGFKQPQLKEGNMLNSSWLDELIPGMDTIFWANMAFQNTQEDFHAMKKKLERAKVGAFIVSMLELAAWRCDVVKRRRLQDTPLNRILVRVPSEAYNVLPNNDADSEVSWSPAPGEYHIYQVDSESGYIAALSASPESLCQKGCPHSH